MPVGSEPQAARGRAASPWTGVSWPHFQGDVIESRGSSPVAMRFGCLVRHPRGMFGGLQAGLKGRCFVVPSGNDCRVLLSREHNQPRCRRSRKQKAARATLTLDKELAAGDGKVSEAALDLAFSNGSERELRQPLPGFDTIDAALKEFAEGRMVIVLDNEDRENEGDLIMAADKVTPEAITFIVNHSSGLICVPMPKARLDELRLPLMVDTAENEEAMRTAFTVTVDARDGITTGISAADRSHTIALLSDPKTTAADLRKPGHVFPLVSREGGVLARPGHTEAAVDLALLSGFSPAGVLCEIVNKDGSMARKAELQRFAREHDLCIITIADLIRYRLFHEQQ